MNKKWKFTSFVLASALICGVAGTSLVGCKDYDDDIDNLQGQIDENKDAIAANKASIDDILAKIEAGQYIQKVGTIANGIRVTLGDGSTVDIVNGAKGDKGDKGDTGEKGEQGEQGPGATFEVSDDGYWIINGDETTYKARGENGNNGKSAYELAVEGGFEGDVTAWMKSLNGDNGKSAYELYVDDAKSKGEEPLDSDAWLASLKGLKGDDGKSAYEVYCSTVTDDEPMSEQEWLQSLVGLSPQIDPITGNWKVWDVKKQDYVVTGVSATGASMYVVKATAPVQGWTLYVKEWDEKEKKFSDEYREIFLPGAATYVTSLVHVPNTISAKYGDVVFFPVIATDYELISSEAKQVYEYDRLNLEKYTTLYKGWAKIEYRVNPNSVSEYKALDFITNQAFVTTRAGNKNIQKEIVTQEAGKLVVSAQGFEFVKGGNEYDDPAGDEAGQFEKADMIAFQVQNTNEKQDIVTSDFAVAKRLVVKQRDINIEFTGSATNVKKPVLYTLTCNELSEEKRNQTFTDLEANLEVNYQKTTEENPLHLRFLLESCVDKLFANVDKSDNAIGQGHFILKDLGFEDLDMEFKAISYKNAEVDQTLDYLYMKDDAIWFTGGASAGLREPVVKVSLFAGKGEGRVLLTEKYLKIKAVRTIQQPYPLQIGNVNWTLACSATTLPCVDVIMDDIFNGTDLEKGQFLATYGEAEVTFKKGNITYDKDWKGITVDTKMEQTATAGVNYLHFTFSPELEAGDYKAEIRYIVAEGNSSATYNVIPIDVNIKVKYPENGPLKVNPSEWDNNQRIVGAVDYTTGKAEYWGCIEDGFYEYELSDCPKATLHFGLNNPETQKVNGVLVSDVVTIEKIDGKHIIKLTHNEDGKKLVGQAVKLRAWVTFNNEDADHTQWANIKVDLTNSHLFDLMFEKPIIAVNEDMSSKLWLVDLKDELTFALGSFFDIYEKATGVENGMLWDNLKGWVDNDRRGYHDVKVIYDLDKTQTNINKGRVNVDRSTGFVSWKKDQNNPGNLIKNDQPIRFIATITHYWGVETVNITVNVKPGTATPPAESDVKQSKSTSKDAGDTEGTEGSN